jgi:hypothetical protein
MFERLVHYLNTKKIPAETIETMLATHMDEQWFAAGVHNSMLDTLIDALTQTDNDEQRYGESDDVLQARADFNRDHAGELFGDKLHQHDGPNGRWFIADVPSTIPGYEHVATCTPVKFTPYGYVVDNDDV